MTGKVLLPGSTNRGLYKKTNIQQMEIPVDITLNVAAVSTAVGFGTVVLADLPEGNLLLLGCVASLAFAAGADTSLVDAWDGDFGLGTTAADDATITGADVDILPSSAIKAVASTKDVATIRVTSTTTEQGAIFDNTANTIDLNLNVVVDADDITDDEDADLAVTGTVSIAFLILGDD